MFSMSLPATQPTPRAERRLQMLDELAEIGMAVARAVQRQAEAEAPSEPGAATLSFNRVSRAMRLTLMLQERFETEGAAAKARAEAQACEEAPPTPEERRKARVERIVERLCQAEHSGDEDEIDRLVIDAGERLDDEDLYGDLMQQPMSVIVARLCRDLDLHPDWGKLSQEYWAQQESSPLPLDKADGHRLAGGERSNTNVGDGSAAVTLTGHPHPKSFPHQGGRECENSSGIPPPDPRRVG